MSNGSDDAFKSSTATPGDGRDRAIAYITDFRQAYETGAFEKAYMAIAEALRTDPTFVWGELVRHHSGPFSMMVEALHKADEAEQLLCELYEEQPGMINIAPPTDDPEIDEKIRTWRNTNIEHGLPYLLFVPMGKSGSTLIGNVLVQGFNLVCTTYSMMQEHVIPPWAQDYARGGACYVTHLVPRVRNIERLLVAGLTKVVVNIRDPRQVFLSGVHHINKYRSEFPQYAHLFDKPVEDQIDALIDIHESQVQWIAGWVVAQEKGISVLFTSYEDFITDREAMADKMLEFYGGNTRYFDRDAAWRFNEKVDYHFRLGEIDEWRRTLDPAVIRRLNANIPDHLFDRFGWHLSARRKSTYRAP